MSKGEKKILFSLVVCRNLQDMPQAFVNCGLGANFLEVRAERMSNNPVSESMTQVVRARARGCQKQPPF